MFEDNVRAFGPPVTEGGPAYCIAHDEEEAHSVFGAGLWVHDGRHGPVTVATIIMGADCGHEQGVELALPEVIDLRDRSSAIIAAIGHWQDDDYEHMADDEGHGPGCPTCAAYGG